jgi:hypothetical protein
MPQIPALSFSLKSPFTSKIMSQLLVWQQELTRMLILRVQSDHLQPSATPHITGEISAKHAGACPP